MDVLNGNWEVGCFSGIKLICEREKIDLRGICPIFFEYLTIFVSELDQYIPSEIIAKYLIGSEVL